MDQYEKIKKTTLRGAKVYKIKELIKSYLLILGEPDFPLEDMYPDITDRKGIETEYLARNVTLTRIQDYLTATFEMKKYSTKEEFFKKIFSGAKVVSVIEFLDFLASNTIKNLESMEKRHAYSLSDLDCREALIIYWKTELTTYLDIKKQILAGFNLQENNLDSDFDFSNKWIESLAEEISKRIKKYHDELNSL